MRWVRRSILSTLAILSVVGCAVIFYGWVASRRDEFEYHVEVGRVDYIFAVERSQGRCRDRATPPRPEPGTPEYARAWDFNRPEAYRKWEAAGFGAYNGEAIITGASGIKSLDRVRGLAVPVWFAVAVSLVLPTLWARQFYKRRRRRRREQLGLCRACGLRPPGECRPLPECGRSNSPVRDLARTT
jgi:hypothetical protein